MLKQFVAIKGVGLFHDASASPMLGRVALVYGENGRGKSTLASILRSCSDGQDAIVTARSTLDGTVAQHIQLTFSDASGADDHVQFSASTWSKPVHQIEVFDADFVSRNVYAGAEINTDQRAGLLEFALGEQAVMLRKGVEDAAAKLTQATVNINTQTTVLKARSGTMSVDAFRKLAVAPTADVEIAAIEKRIAAANAREELLKKSVPSQVALPTFDATNLFAILGKSLPEIEAAAEHAVRQHLKKCTHPNFEQWVALGSTYDTGDDCPYCGTSITDNELIKAYRTHFNKAYGDLKAEASKLEDQVHRRLGDAIVDGLERSFETAQAHLDGWKGFVNRAPIAFDSSAMKTVLVQLRALIEPLATSKARQPLEPIGSASDMTQAAALWKSATEFVTVANTTIGEGAASIDAYKKSLAAEDISALRAAIETLNLRKLRHTPGVVAELDQLKQFTDAKKARSDEKDNSRKALDTLMAGMLAAYQAEINTLLSGFGVQIRIDDLGFDYRGGAGLPRSDYQLKVRGREVRLAGGGSAAFGNTLSEGDKRSLAFAFFIARLHQDPQLTDRIVVIDDPMCSLDRRRRAATIRVLKVLATKCKQLVVLAHDPYFLQTLDDELRKLPIAKPAGALSYCKIMPSANDYSSFGTLALADECSSRYENDLAAVMGYVDAKPGLDRDHVAKCLRVVLETSLHRQFPSLIPRSAMLGDVITTIEKAVIPSVLAALHSSVKELRALNDYGKAFHHAEDGMPPNLTNIDEGELRSYCVRVLAFVLRG
jgi:wobble nucleotide-excising tRNase